MRGGCATAEGQSALTAWSLPAALLAVAGATAVIAIVGPRLARVADRLADRTGLGEAVAGALLLGAATSLAALFATYPTWSAWVL